MKKAPAKWYEIRAKSSSPEIWIYGDIGDDWLEETTSARSFVSELQSIDADAITIRVNSYGGSVPDGLAIYNAIKRHDAHVTVVIDGIAASIASLITAAGDTVEMAENAMMMIHAPWGAAIGNAEDMRDKAATLDKWAEAMAASHVAKSGQSKEAILSLLTDGKDHYFTASEALAEGFIDAIVEPMAIAASASDAVRAAALARFKPKASEEINVSGDGVQPGLENLMQKILSHISERNTMTEKEKKAAEAKAAKLAAEKAATEAKAKADAETKARADIEAKAKADALAADKLRRDAVRAQFAPFRGREGIDELEAKLVDNVKITAEAAGLQILAKLGEGTESVAGHIRMTGDDGAERFRQDAVAHILVKAGLASKDVRASASKAPNLKSFKLLDFARASLDRAGINHSSMDQLKIVGAAFTTSTSDFPVLLENAMHKALQDAYAVAPDTWSRFCSTGSVSDFRAHNRYRTGSLGNLDSLNELGEYQNKTIPDGEKGSITADTKGNIINISRKMIVNDDLGAFLSLAANLGRSGRRTVEAAVYALLAENAGLGPTLTDGDTLFHANHGNIGAGVALSVAGIDADRVLMATQTDVGGNDFLDLVPSVLLVATGLGGAAREINAQEYNDDSQKNQRRPNSVRGLFSDVVDTPRLTGTRRYLFASPQSAPVIEVAFLDGNQEPYIEQQTGFTVDGSMWKARLDFGVAAIDYRGATTDAGV